MRSYAITKAIVALIVLFSFGLLTYAVATHNSVVVKDETDDFFTTTADTSVYIVYTDDDDICAKPVLSADYRERLAHIVAGKAGNKSMPCQKMVACAIMNEIDECGDLDAAIDKYALYDSKEPSEDTYYAVDAIFESDEKVFDNDVLWFNDTNGNSTFHDSLVFVTECDGIAFYKAHIQNIVSDGDFR